MGADTHELTELASDLGRAAKPAEVVAVVRKGATNIKDDLRREAETKHFQFARAISFDMVGAFAAEIGPERGSPGSIANIAYFGGRNGGGGTVPDPSGALMREAPKFEEALLDLAVRRIL